MKRAQELQIRKDLEKKIVFIVGPRQVGKTWLARRIGESFPNNVYLNYDRFEDRRIIHEENWLPDTDLLILDELHKMPGWKRFLKGVYDTRPEGMRILVTGSARLDTFRQGGESLAGRFFAHRLLPFSVSELIRTDATLRMTRKTAPSESKAEPTEPSIVRPKRDSKNVEQMIDRLIDRGGFPEPFISDETTDAQRWRLHYVDGLIREEILDFARLAELRTMRLLLELLRERVGSPISYASLARDLQAAPNTVKKYIEILEALFIVFRVTPFSRNIARSLLKEPKIYFFDTGMTKDDPGARFENLMAVSLLKHVWGLTDTTGRRHELKYLRTKDRREVDFCLVKEQTATQLIEAKYADAKPAKSLVYFRERLSLPATQVVRHLKRQRIESGLEIRRASTFLSHLWPNNAAPS
jgi:hypothetical protein